MRIRKKDCRPLKNRKYSCNTRFGHPAGSGVFREKEGGAVKAAFTRSEVRYLPQKPGLRGTAPESVWWFPWKPGFARRREGTGRNGCFV